METQGVSMTEVANPVEIHVKATAVLFQAEPDVIDRDAVVWQVGEYNRYWAASNREGCESAAKEIDRFVAKYFPTATKGKK